MDAPLTLSLVIPAYNEAGRLPATLNQIVAYLEQTPWDWTIRIVDDGSTDGTARVAEGYAGRDPRIIVQREPHGGKGAAVKAGLLAATGSYRFICDADLSMPIRELARFLPPLLAGADVAIGTREGAGARRVAEPTRRHLVGRTFNYLVQRLLLPGLHDTQCGFKMFTAVAVERIFRDMTVDGWSFDIEALYLARRCGLRIVEVPIEWHYRAESRLNVLRDGPAMLLDLLRIRFRG
ncbi:MAG TPA: dolichyl-phosphate beta-glucosyltransferase [Vicinamibacterales bacterium]|jgi:dolichyl-phosphate beta-glucosyltransferase|nr:dolichyl-phosphate beta-glucosyltransferase [Vicinamibacterales bacterium]